MRNSIRFVIALLSLAIPLHAADFVYLVIDGIPGEVVQKGREGWVRALAFNHEIVSPRDPATGLASGRRQHQPLRVVIPHDKSLPPLMQALVLNKPILKITVNFFRPNASGVDELYMKYDLTNVSVSSMRPWMPNTRDPNTLDFGAQVEVAFTYQRIAWTFINGGITADDTWSELR
jgi:type VI secretion system secreted protein Hcp